MLYEASFRFEAKTDAEALAYFVKGEVGQLPRGCLTIRNLTRLQLLRSTILGGLFLAFWTVVILGGIQLWARLA